MYKTIYDKNTGSIIICRKISDALLAERLAKFPNQAALDVYTADVVNSRVDLDTLTVVSSPQVEDLNHWMRTRRKAELISCDWTQAADSPLSSSKKTEWANYRQALRDLPNTYPNVTDKDDVVWPTKPE